MTDYKKYINALRKCAKEHENDRTSMGHIIVSDLCGDTANLLESLEQEPKTGHWILKRTFSTKLYDEYLNEYKCSECYREIRCTESQLVNYPYCHCGVKMLPTDSDCDSCGYQNEVDGSNCYECVKGIRNNYKAESDIEKRKEWPHEPCINYEDGCEEWAGCPCVHYKAENEVQE